jgi:hypothetical protein
VNNSPLPAYVRGGGFHAAVAPHRGMNTRNDRLTGALPEQRWYRVEHRDVLGRRTLGRVPNVYAHHHSLTPFVARLLLDGAIGEIILVEETTGREVARRSLAIPLRPWGSAESGEW